MATLSAAMVTLLTDNWAGAGAAPTFGALIDYQKDLADTTEQVIVRLPIYLDDADPINDIYSNFKYVVQLRVKTTVSEDRLKVLTDETIRILNTYAITGISRQFAKRGENTSDRRRKIYSYDVWASLEEHVSTGGTAYASPGAGDVVFPADITVKGGDITQGSATLAEAVRTDMRAADGNAIDILMRGATTDATHANWYWGRNANNRDFEIISYDGAWRTWLQLDHINQNIQLNDGTVDISTTQLADLLMFGSANAAWVPCVIQMEAQMTYVGPTITNVGSSDATLVYILPRPTNKGSLKLYIAQLRVELGDADADDYVTRVRVFGVDHDSMAAVIDEPTDRTAAGQFDTDPADQDMSGYSSVYVYVECVNTNANDLDIKNILLSCYYAA